MVPLDGAFRGAWYCDWCQSEFVDGKADQEPSKDSPEGVEEKSVLRVGLESFGIFQPAVSTAAVS